tara:strand:- start:80 stop:1141 length:1062 start_codon:yes stop_codon:yes gene_type:complete
MSQINQIREGLASLGTAVETIATTPVPDTPNATINSISGNAIHGGKITLLRSTGITDTASKLVLLVDDDGITVDNIDTDTLHGDVGVTGNLTIHGELKANKLHVEELSSTIKHTESIDFQTNGTLMGMQWRVAGEATKQIVWRDDRFYVSNTIDLHRNASIEIDNIPVLSADTLGKTIHNSSLRKVGTLVNLKAQGDVNFDEFVQYDSGTERFAIGTEAPNGQLSVSSIEAEYIVDPQFDDVKVGTYTTSKMSFITDNKDRLIIKEQGGVEVKGSLGVNEPYPGHDVDLQVKGAIRFQDKRVSVSDNIPSPGQGTHNRGDIIYNTLPEAGGWVGWICTESGDPGVWNKFGAIE